MNHRALIAAVHRALRSGQTLLARQRHARLCKLEARLAAGKASRTRREAL
jgi:hypothetical protein